MAKIIFAGMILNVGLLFINHFKRDIFNYPIEYYILKSDTANLGTEYRYSTVLLSNAPYLEKNIKRRLEETFWKYVTLDTLRYYMAYSMTFYRETKYLTRNFKEGNQYVPFYSHWDNNTMDWRNHFKDRLGYIELSIRKDGTVYYTSVIYDSGYGVKMFIDIVKSNRYSKEFSDIEHAYLEKCRELGIDKDDRIY